MSGKIGTDPVALASPVMAIVTAFFLGGYTALLSQLDSVSGGTKVEYLLKTGILVFFTGEAAALILGYFGILRVRMRKSSRGIPEAILGIISSCLLSLTAAFFTYKIANA